MSRKDDEIRPKGDRELQSIYFLNAEMFRGFSDGDHSKSAEMRRIALFQRTKGLLLQNPKPEDLKEAEKRTS